MKEKERRGEGERKGERKDEIEGSVRDNGKKGRKGTKWMRRE